MWLKLVSDVLNPTLERSVKKTFLPLEKVLEI